MLFWSFIQIFKYFFLKKRLMQKHAFYVEFYSIKHRQLPSWEIHKILTYVIEFHRFVTLYHKLGGINFFLNKRLVMAIQVPIMTIGDLEQTVIWCRAYNTICNFNSLLKVSFPLLILGCSMVILHLAFFFLPYLRPVKNFVLCSIIAVVKTRPEVPSSSAMATKG